ncbi:uncharacterized protein LOC142325162 isoform X4 [Lycorma delicatula]
MAGIYIGQKKKKNTPRKIIHNNSYCNEKISEKSSKRTLKDKTNSVFIKHKRIKNYLKMNHDQSKNMTRIYQRRISDFFHEDKEYNTIDKTSQSESIQRNNKTKILNRSYSDDSFTDKDDYDDDKVIQEASLTVTSSSIVNKGNHTPVYKQLPLENSNRTLKSEEKDKSMLYEFEVNENEEPVIRKNKKRCNFKITRLRKKICKQNKSLKSPELNQIPQRRLPLETNTNNSKLVCNKIMSNDVINKTESNKLDLKNLNDTVKTQKNEMYKPCIKKQLSVSKNISSDHQNISETPQDVIFKNSKGSDKSDITNLSISFQTRVTPNGSVDSSPLSGPLTDNLRFARDFKSGFINSSGSNERSNMDYSNSFIRGITASTPIRPLSSLIKSSTLQVRLSGGLVSNKYAHHFINESDDDIDEEGFFGFKENENHEDSFYSSLSNNTTLDKTINETLQQISVHEVINLLKNEVEKVSKNKLLNKPVSNSQVISDSFIDEQWKLSPGNNQQSIDKFINKEKDKKDKVEVDENFTKPPRRSYTPHKRKLLNRHVDNRESTENVYEENYEKEVVETHQNKKAKLPKKQEQDLEKLAAVMNSQFKDVEQYHLCIE